MNNVFQNFMNNFNPGQPAMMHRGSRGRAPVYFETLKALPEEYSEKIGTLKNSNKGALNILAIQSVPNPMIFCVKNMFLDKQTYVGVLEFVAQEGIIIMPTQVFQNLNLEPHQQVSVALTPDIPKGKFIQIQPHETAFIELPDPRAVLEYHLRNYTCFTEGDTISIDFNKKTYKLDILKVKPENQYKCVCVIETDLEIDFAPPLDYQEMKLPSMKKSESTVVYEQEKSKELGKSEEFSVFQGKSVRLDGKPAVATNLKTSKDSSLLSTTGIGLGTTTGYMKSSGEGEYDPRKHKLQNGVKTKILNEVFEKDSVKLGESKDYYKPPAGKKK